MRWVAVILVLAGCGQAIPEAASVSADEQACSGFEAVGTWVREGDSLTIFEDCSGTTFKCGQKFVVNEYYKNDTAKITVTHQTGSGLCYSSGSPIVTLSVEGDVLTIEWPNLGVGPVEYERE